MKIRIRVKMWTQAYNYFGPPLSYEKVYEFKSDKNIKLPNELVWSPIWWDNGFPLTENL